MCVCFFATSSSIYSMSWTLQFVCWFVGKKNHGFALRSCCADFGAKECEKKDGCLALEGQHRCFIDITCYYAGKNICKWFFYTNPGSPWSPNVEVISLLYVCCFYSERPTAFLLKTTRLLEHLNVDGYGVSTLLRWMQRIHDPMAEKKHLRCRISFSIYLWTKRTFIYPNSDVQPPFLQLLKSFPGKWFHVFLIEKGRKYLQYYTHFEQNDNLHRNLVHKSCINDMGSWVPQQYPGIRMLSASYIEM